VLHAYRRQVEPGTVHVTAENDSGTIDVVVADDDKGCFPASTAQVEDWAFRSSAV
jgi:hypothetical protein